MAFLRNLFTIGALFGFIAALLVATPAHAQGRISKNALEHTKFYESQREIQIIDDRPVIKDFRQAPQADETVALPPPPPGFGGTAAGSGALGNMADLPRAGFAPARSLPRGGLIAHAPALRAPQAMAAAPRSSRNARGNLLAPPRAARPAAAAPAVAASYGGYGGGSGYGQAASQTSSHVSGTLLRH